MFHISSSSSSSLSALLTWRSAIATRDSRSAMTLELSRTPLSYQDRMILSLRLRKSAISATWATWVAWTAFMRSPNAMRVVLSVGSGIGLSLIAVKEESVDGNDEAEARTMDWMASVESSDGGSAGSAA